MKNKKIDLVYLWVDGSDPKWIRRKNKFLKSVGLAEIPEAAHRYKDNDELKYSLRSVEKFAPWINHIFIITDDQVPAWLNTKHPKITIVDHTDIIPKKYLPVFSPRPPLVSLSKIPGLSEYFLLADDDMLFGNYTTPDYFFTADDKVKVHGKSYSMKKFIKNSAPRINSGDYIKAIMNAKTLIREIHGDSHNYEWEPSHNITGYKKSSVESAYNHPKINKAIEITYKSKIRGRDDLSQVIFQEYMLANDIAHLELVPKFGIKNIIEKFKGNISRAYQAKKIKKRLFMPWPKLFCVNNSGMHPRIDKYNNKVLSKMFPKKSSFEV
ncbi:MAG: stealth family protein [Alphaproteobacteria bacterium]|nr:stealth family protein [Alphaproteobacteria bacterium]